MSCSMEGLDTRNVGRGVGLAAGFDEGQEAMGGEPRGEALELAVAALEAGRFEEADGIATMALVDRGSEPGLWMAAGLARLSRGRLRSARDAFRMCAWLSGDEVAGEMVELLEGRGR